jgi:hypothetical protein
MSTDFVFPATANKTTAGKGDVGSHIHPRVTFISSNWSSAKPNLAQTKSLPTGTSSTTTLYLPNGFSEKYAATWGETELVTALLKANLNMSEGFGLDATSAKASAAESAQHALKASLGGIVNSAIYSTGETAFPGQFNVFQKSAPINMDFTFDLVPRNEPEARLIVNICSNFKDKILPTFGQGTNFISQFMLQFPDVWTIRFNGINGVGFPGSAGMYPNMALTACNVSYGGGANSALIYHDGNPVIVTLHLSFTSIKHAYKGGPS